MSTWPRFSIYNFPTKSISGLGKPGDCLSIAGWGRARAVCFCLLHGSTFLLFIRLPGALKYDSSQRSVVSMARYFSGRMFSTGQPVPKSPCKYSVHTVCACGHGSSAVKLCLQDTSSCGHATKRNVVQSQRRSHMLSSSLFRRLAT